MQPDDEIDKLIKTALENLTASYSENDWQKMETLLNKHLPQTKDNRPNGAWFAIAFIGLVFITSIFFILKSTRKESATTIKKTDPQKNIAESSRLNQPQPTPQSTTAAANNANKTITANTTEGIEDIGAKKNSPGKTTLKQPVAVVEKNNTLTGKKKQLNANLPSVTKIKQKKGTARQSSPTPIAITKRQHSFDEPHTISTPFVENIFIHKNDVKEINTSSIDIGPMLPAEIINAANPAVETAPDPLPVKFINHLYVSAYVGPDLTFVKGNSAKIGIRAGAGISYNFHKNLSINIGFYISNKRYSAGPESYSYTPRPGSDLLLKKATVNSFVYEIPISILFHFTRSKQWHLSAGTNSFIMKKEKYNYTLYNSTSGEIKNIEFQIKNKNKYLYSIYRFGAGYSFLTWDKITLTFGPYINIPAQGLGEGKVKLCNGGIVVTGSLPLF